MSDLRVLRRQRLGSLVRASRASGIPSSTLAAWETGERRMTDESVARLARALGVPESEIVASAPSRRTVHLQAGVSPTTREWLAMQSRRRGITIGALLDRIADQAVRRSAA